MASQEDVATDHVAWERFLKRAKKTHARGLEHIEALWGHETEGTFYVAEFQPLKGVYSRSRTGLSFESTEPEKHKLMAKRRGLTWLGTIHTHPDFCDTSGSTEDHVESSNMGERVFGVVRLFKKKGRWYHEVDWWIPQMPLKFRFHDQPSGVSDATTTSLQSAPAGEVPAPGQETLARDGQGAQPIHGGAKAKGNDHPRQPQEARGYGLRHPGHDQSEEALSNEDQAQEARAQQAETA